VEAVREQPALRRDVACVIASAAGWAFTIALALYAYYEDGPAGIAFAAAVRYLPAALVEPPGRALVQRIAPRTALAASAAARAACLGAVAIGVALDVPFPAILALVAAFRMAGAGEAWSYAALDPRFDGSPTRLRAAQARRHRLDEAGFLAGALAAGACMALLSLHAVFTLAAIAFAVAAVAALTAPACAAVPARGDGVHRVRLRAAWAHDDARRLHALRGGRAAARSLVELMVVIASVDLMSMGDQGFGWLSAAWAAGLVGGAYLLGRGGVALSARAVAAGSALAGAALLVLALHPAVAVAVAVLVGLGAGFALVRGYERTLDSGLPATVAVERGELVDALARTLGAGLAAVLALELGDVGALAAAGVFVAALGAVSLVTRAPAEERAPQLARG
jgi:hypothetical protein